MANVLNKINIPASTLSDLPNTNNKTHEAQYINELTFKRTRTNSGNISWTSETSGITYNTSDYQSNINIYNSGETGLLNLLQMECAEFLMDATDFTSLGEHYNVIQNLTITGGRYYKIAQIDISTDTSYYNQLSLLIGGTGVNTTSFRGYYFVDFSTDITGTDLNVTQFYSSNYFLVMPNIPQDEIFFGYNVNDTTNKVELWVYLAQNMESFGVTVINNYEKNKTNVFEIGDLAQTITSPSNFVRVSSQHLMKNSEVYNHNLFINSNFQNPINQQGRNLYTPATMTDLTIDRWHLTDTLNSSALTLLVNYPSSTNGTGFCSIIVPANDTATFYQKIEAKNINFSPYTVYFYMSNLSQVDGLIVTQNFSGGTTSNINVTMKKEIYSEDSGIVYGTFTATLGTIESLSVGIKISSSSTDTTFRMLYAKLEKGQFPTQFITPNIEEELLKCQRFYYKISNPNTTNALVLGSGYAPVANQFSFQVALPCTMYKNPSVQFVANSLETRIYNSSTKIKVTSLSYRQMAPNSNLITIGATVASGISVNNVGVMTLTDATTLADGYIEFVAEL